MMQEQKQLLLKDLYARSPYGVKVWYPNGNGAVSTVKGIVDDICYFNENPIHGNFCHIETVKPYLRPMSSMTEEEKDEVRKLGVCYDGAFHNDIYDIGTSMEEAFLAISWLLERHFDINYLIQKGLALEAPEGMYE